MYAIRSYYEIQNSSEDEKIIGWNNDQHNPIFHFTFPQKGKLNDLDFNNTINFLHLNTDKQPNTNSPKKFQERLDVSINFTRITRTVRNYSMSCMSGKVRTGGFTKFNNKKHFVLESIQDRISNWVNQLFLAKYTPIAQGIDNLQPSFDVVHFLMNKN